MCPPVSIRHRTRGMPYLFVAWLYHLVHGDQMKICFACFKEAFLVVRRTLETGDWEEEVLDNESVVLSEDGSDPDAWLGLELTEFQSHGYLPQMETEHAGPGFPVSAPVWPVPEPVPTELRPDEAVPLDGGPEIDDWTQVLPLRLGIFRCCLHRRIIPPLSWCDVTYFNPYPGQPVLLELSPIWPMQLLVESLLVHLKFVTVLGDFDDVCYLLSMRPCWAVRTQVHRWQMLLDPGELRKAYLQNEPQQPNLYRWRLSVLESSELGVELVPADCSLRKGGFKVHSYLPWDSDTPEDWSTDPGERVFIKYVESQRDLSYSVRRHFIDNFLS
ncbi:testis-expressed protein 19.2-like [Arvicola amphibius]|uniref:testis-expressed protein 19.2-like n=1 Tax=Arvicola amphibius TaxID=1047088 RepID=UPI0018E2CD61|nr:testis-expressed protein 19.2-like [Arvicola amphibius]